MILRVELYCPPMAIHLTADPRVRITDAEPMEFRGKLVDESGMVVERFEAKPITIPETSIDKIGLLQWRVRKCVGQGSQNGVFVRSELPEEDSYWSWWKFAFIAEQMKAPTTVVIMGNGPLNPGKKFSGIVTYPEARLSVRTMTVGALTATGDLEEVK